MNQNDVLTEVLAGHLALCQEALDLAQQENAALSNRFASTPAQSNETKKKLAAGLTGSLNRLREARHARQTSGPTGAHPDARVSALIRASQDLMLRVLVLSRENERLFLQRGLFAPQNLPSAQSQRPHFVADLYRRHSAAPVACPRGN